MFDAEFVHVHIFRTLRAGRFLWETSHRQRPPVMFPTQGPTIYIVVAFETFDPPVTVVVLAKGGGEYGSGAHVERTMEGTSLKYFVASPAPPLPEHFLLAYQTRHYNMSEN